MNAVNGPRYSAARRIFVLLALTSVPTFSQDAATLKSRFAALFNSAATGRYARMVWLKMGGNMWKPDVGAADIFVMDTKDGVVRTLVPRSSSAVYAPSFTWDGRYIIYYSNSDLTVHRIDWEGKKDTVILRNWEGGGRCWQSPDGKQWTLATEFKGNGVNGAGLYRVNVENPTERVQLLTCSNWSRVTWMGSTSWASISVDGKYVSGGFPNYGALGTFAVRTPVPTTVRKLSPNGCWISMARDNSYRVLYTNDGTLTHKELYIGDTTGRKIVSKSLVGTTILPGGATDGFESLRWTSDTGFCTLWSGWYQNGQCDGRGTTNPKIVRISDLAWAGIHDNTTTAEGNCDVWFYSGSGTMAGPAPLRTNPVAGLSRDFGVYDSRGRRIRDARTATPGIRIGIGAGSTGIRVSGISIQPSR